MYDVYDTMWYDGLYLGVPKSLRIANLICGMEPNKKKSNEETKNKNSRCWEELIS